MKTSTGVPTHADRPLTPRGRLRLFWLGFRDGRRAVLPDKGWTPAAQLIRTAAITSVTSRQEELGQREVQLKVERAGVEAQLSAAQQQCRANQQALQSVAARVDPDQLPERAVSGEPKLIRSLAVAMAEAQLGVNRAAASSNYEASVANRDGLSARHAQIVEQLDQLRPELLRYARYLAAQADLRIAYYSTILFRWHKDRQQLHPLLPFGRVSDEIDRLIDTTTLAAPNSRPTLPMSALNRTE